MSQERTGPPGGRRPAATPDHFPSRWSRPGAAHTQIQILFIDVQIAFVVHAQRFKSVQVPCSLPFRTRLIHRLSHERDPATLHHPPGGIRIHQRPSPLRGERFALHFAEPALLGLPVVHQRRWEPILGPAMRSPPAFLDSRPAARPEAYSTAFQPAFEVRPVLPAALDSSSAEKKSSAGQVTGTDSDSEFKLGRTLNLDAVPNLMVEHINKGFFLNARVAGRQNSQVYWCSQV